MEYREFLRILRKRLWIILLIWFMVVAGYSIFFFSQDPTYTTKSRIILNLPPKWKNMSVLSMPSWQTRIQTVTSKPVLKRTKDHLKRKNITKSIGELRSSISVHGIEGTDFVDIRVRNAPATDAIQVARAVTRIFLDQDRKNNKSTLNSAETNIQKQIRRVNNNLADLEAKTAKIKEKQGLHSPDAQFSNKLKTLSQLNDQEIDLKFKLKDTANKLDHFEQILVNQSEQIDQADLDINRSLVQDLTSELSKAKIELNQVKQQYGPKHPKRKRLEKKVEETRKELQDSISQLAQNLPVIEKEELRRKISDLTLERQLIKAKRTAIDNRIDRLENEIDKLSQAKSRLVELNRRISLKKGRLKHLQEQLDQIEFNKSLLNNSGRVVSLPSNASAKYSTTYKTYGFIILAGLLFGFSTGGFLEYLNDKIETKFEILRYLDLPVFGTIPQVNGNDLNLLEIPEKSPLAEQYHSITVRLEQKLLEQDDLQSVLVASSIRGEGKSITLVNLGVSLAREGEKVLLLDLDLRDPWLHGAFNMMNSKGLSTYLEGELRADLELEMMDNEGDFDEWGPIEAIIESTDQDGLDVIPSGPIPSNPIQLMKNGQLNKLLDTVKDEYGIILIDSPPLHSVIDAMVVANNCDGSLMVCRSGVVRKGQAQHSKHILDDSNSPILGVILNGVRYESESYYSYYQQTREDEKNRRA